ncbi:TMhelix containing protein [Vibrio phage 1.081.O._10N.286.52.C2]|nr:TMhelix containing protein [Vibrio phage 1.081.O._10N.286.52.C2]
MSILVVGGLIILIGIILGWLLFNLTFFRFLVMMVLGLIEAILVLALFGG